MRYREIDAILHLAESQDNLAAALKDGKAAKEFRKEREALEKAAGGKKKLDEADKILADAKMDTASSLVEAAEMVIAASKIGVAK